MAAPVINWGKMVVKDVYPQTLPDLFAGQQLTVFGRYENSGDAAIQLVGTRLGRKDVQTFEGTFGAETGNSFVEKIWAGRHVGFLLDEIRLRGEKQELKDEVIRLSRLYGIQTPYTSYLILESKEQYAQHGLTTGTPYASGGGTGGDHLAGKPARAEEVKKDLDDRSRGKAEKPTQAGAAGEAISDGYGYGMGGAAGPRETEKRAEEAMKQVSGVEAVRVAKDVRDMKEGASERRSGAPLVKRIGERSFYLYRGFWVDGDFNEKLPTLSVKVLSDACFQLIDKLPELKDVFALGERVIVVVNGTAVIVEEGGKEKLTDEELNSLVKK
jgi:Ca-activated chloride channel family protein